MNVAGTVDWQLDRDSGVPVYAQIERRLGELIESGAIPVGERVPSERELAELTGVSRLTARAALDALARKGLLERGIGRRGSVVSRSKLTFDLTEFGGFTEMVSRHGIAATARVQKLSQTTAPRAVAAELQIPRGAPVYRVRRLRLAEDAPVALEDSWIPAGRFPGFLELDLRGSLYAVMRDEYGIEPVHAIQRLEPTLANARQADALSVPRASPLMLVHRVAHCRAGIPVEFARDHHRGDRARFTIEVSTPAWRGIRADDVTGEPQV